MFDEKLLRELAALEAGGPILSVYLNVDPTQHTTEEHKLILRDLLKQVEGDVDVADIEAVKHYVDLEYDGAGRGLARPEGQYCQKNPRFVFDGSIPGHCFLLSCCGE